jgi:hypothetical protein
MPHRIGLLAAALACAASAASAQEIVYAQIPWGASADSVRARMEAQGFEYGGVVGNGDRAFGRADGAVHAIIRTGRVVGFSTLEAAAGAAADARFRVLADSLEAAFGPPLDRRPEFRLWETGLTSAVVTMSTDPASGERQVRTEWRGPGWFDEMDRRGSLLAVPALPNGYTAVNMNGGSRISVDTATMVRRAGQPLRARFRIDYVQPVPDAGYQYDAIEYGMDFDCSGGRTRMVSRTTWLGGRRNRNDAAEGLPWAPARAGTDASRGLDAVCRVAGRGPATVAQPTERRSFAAPAAGWLLITESPEGRWLLDSASVRAKAAGVTGATMRVEAGMLRDSPLGRMDAVRFQVDVDCAGSRWRFVSGTAQRQGRDLGAMPIPAQQTAWTPGAGNPVVDAVCRIAGRRP